MQIFFAYHLLSLPPAKIQFKKSCLREQKNLWRPRHSVSQDEERNSDSREEHQTRDAPRRKQGWKQGQVDEDALAVT